MAISATKRAETASTSNTASYTSGSYTPSANALLVACFVATAEATNAPTVTGNGLTWTQANVEPKGTAITHVYYALTGSSPSTGGVTINYGADSATGCGITVMEFTGVDLTTPITQSAINSGNTGTTPSFTFSSATNASCAVLGLLLDLTANPPGLTAPTGYTTATASGFSTPTTGWEVDYHLSPGSVTTVSWGGTSGGSWAAIGVEIAAAAAADRDAEISWAEFEVPNAPRGAQLSWAEIEVPNAPRQAWLSWAELEVPTAPRQGQISWAELETPVGPVSAQLSFAELEVGDAPRQGQISFVELQVPDAARQAQLSWAELEVPNGPRQAQISWAAVEVTDAPRAANISFAELETPDDRQAQISFAELQAPDAARGTQISWAELQVPRTPTGLITPESLDGTVYDAWKHRPPINRQAYRKKRGPF